MTKKQSELINLIQTIKDINFDSYYLGDVLYQLTKRKTIHENWGFFLVPNIPKKGHGKEVWYKAGFEVWSHDYKLIQKVYNKDLGWQNTQDILDNIEAVCQEIERFSKLSREV